MDIWAVQHPQLALAIVFIALLICTRRLLLSAHIRFETTTKPLALRIDALLPQTQCGHCGYPGCKPYAEAIASGDAFNKCLPGGDATVRNLATLLERDVIALDAPQPPPLSYAFIREAECIGCTKCIQACPVDAILGAAKLMHTVIRDECTGCDLCVEPCPVDCIEMRPFTFAGDQRPKLIISDGGYDARDRGRAERADHYRSRFEAHQVRIAREHDEKEKRRHQRTTTATEANDSSTTTPAVDDKLAIIAAALARTQAKKAAQLANPPVAEKSPEDPTAKRARELAAIDRRIESTQLKLHQAINTGDADKVAALQNALNTLHQKHKDVGAADASQEHP